MTKEILAISLGWKNGRTVPAVETIEKFARALQVSMYQLFYEGDKPRELPNLSKRKTEDDISLGHYRKARSLPGEVSTTPGAGQLTSHDHEIALQIDCTARPGRWLRTGPNADSRHACRAYAPGMARRLQQRRSRPDRDLCKDHRLDAVRRRVDRIPQPHGRIRSAVDREQRAAAYSLPREGERTAPRQRSATCW